MADVSYQFVKGTSHSKTGLPVVAPDQNDHAGAQLTNCATVQTSATTTFAGQVMIMPIGGNIRITMSQVDGTDPADPTSTTGIRLVQDVLYTFDIGSNWRFKALNAT